MPLGVWNPEWLAVNGTRRYPLTADATAQNADGSFVIPNDFLVSLDLPVHSGLDVDPARFFIWKLAAYSSGYGITVGYQPVVGDPQMVAIAMVARGTHTLNTTYVLGGVNLFADTVGKLTVGDLDAINAQPAGMFTFTLAATRIEPDCIRPILRGLSSLVVVNGSERSQPFYGDIELVADSNIELTPVTVDGQVQIRISAVDATGLSGTCYCEGADAGPCIRRISGISPTAGGDFSVLGSDCLEVQTIKNGVRLVDTCSQPCCGCTELEAITADLERYGVNAATLGSFVSRLESVIAQMNTTVLGSKLGDVGCAVPIV